MEGGRIILKSRRNISFKKVLWNEPTFGLIHLAGQYLSWKFPGGVLEKPARLPSYESLLKIPRHLIQ
jgi:hypothetical protein